VLKEFYREPKWVRKEVEKRFIRIVYKYKLESEQPLFKMAMVNNSAWAMEQPPPRFNLHIPILNLLIKIWRQLNANIAMVQALGLVEDERAFFSLTFFKDKLKNRLDGNHLGIVVGMHGQSVYTLETFPYDDCFKQWMHSVERHCYGTSA
jgi:hypothetical protein